MNKEDIVAWLDEHKIPYLTDPTNVSPEFLRNRIRSNVLPALRECDARFDQNFLSTLDKLQAADRVLTELTTYLYNQITTTQNGTAHLNLKEFFSLDPYLQKRVLMLWLISQDVLFVPQEAFLDEIIRFLGQPGSKTHQIHRTWGIAKEKDSASIKKT